MKKDLIISKTPLRISFFGGGTDYKEYYSKNGGAVINTAINKYVYVFLKPWFSKSIRVSYSNGELASSLEEIKHNLVREAMRFLGVNGGLEISYVSDIPIGSSGTGLGSSSSLLVGLLNALHAYKGELVSSDVLALEAFKIEREILNHSGGKQDQYAASFGGFNYIGFNPDESVFIESLEKDHDFLKLLKSKLMIFYTGLPTAGAVSKEQSDKTVSNFKYLDELFELTKEAKKKILKNDIKEFGYFLDKNWQLKQKLATHITNSNLDLIYKKAKEAGASGGKVLGSGGGGFFLIFGEEGYHQKIRDALVGLQEINFDFDMVGSRILEINDNQ